MEFGVLGLEGSGGYHQPVFNNGPQAKHGEESQRGYNNDNAGEGQAESPAMGGQGSRRGFDGFL